MIARATRSAVSWRSVTWTADCTYCVSRRATMESGLSFFAEPTSERGNDMKRRRMPLIDADGEVRELTKADIARMRPATEVVPHVVEAWRRPRGRPPEGAPQQPNPLRLSPEVLAFFRKQGRGWQTRVDEVLSRYVKRKAA